MTECAIDGLRRHDPEGRQLAARNGYDAGGCRRDRVLARSRAWIGLVGGGERTNARPCRNDVVAVELRAGEEVVRRGEQVGDVGLARANPVWSSGRERV